MCTVTFLPSKEGFILTSNRDEKSLRPTLKPALYSHDQQSLIYPKDELAGGTWIATNTKGRFACLLNGAFEPHIKGDGYLKSRGKVLLESFDYNSHEEFAESVIVFGVEPFTLLLIDSNPEIKITEIRWDEKQLHFTPKSAQNFHIWSSSTLYSPENRKEREKWFMDWITKYRDEEDYNIFNFHNQKHSTNDASDILMHRDDGIQTVSVTQFKISDHHRYMYYHDLLNKVTDTINLNKIFHEKE